MKKVKFFLIPIIIAILNIGGCSETTEPSNGDNEEVIAAMAEADQLIGLLSQSGGFEAVTNVPETAMGYADLNLKFPGKFLGKTLNTPTRTDPMLVFMYMFFPKGTYTYDGNQWSYDELPDDEVIFTFPYDDPETGLSHTAILRYYDFQISAVLLTTSMDIYVDGTQMVEINIQLQGTGFLDMIGINQPNITSISIIGFVVDDSGTQYNYSMTITETQITLMAGTDGNTPITIILEGDVLTSSMNPIPSPKIIDDINSNSSNDPESITLTYGDLVIQIDDLNAESGDIGYITYGGVRVANITIIDGNTYLIWNDGTQVLINTYIPNTAGMGGEFI